MVTIFLVEVLVWAFFYLVGELFFQLGVRGLFGLFLPETQQNRYLSMLGYTLVGALAGWLSLAIQPLRMIHDETAQLANLVLTPPLAGITMNELGKIRVKRSERTIGLDRFFYAFLVAFAMALVRYCFAV